MTSTIPLRFRRLQPYLIANTNQIPQGLYVESRPAQEHLHFAAAQVVQPVRSLQKLIDNVSAHFAHLLQRSIAREQSL